MPLLYASMSGGRVLAVIFFLCITLAGLSSLISIMEQSVHILEDFGGLYAKHFCYLHKTIEYSLSVCTAYIRRSIPLQLIEFLCTGKVKNSS